MPSCCGWIWAWLSRRCSQSSDLMFLCGKVIQVLLASDQLQGRPRHLESRPFETIPLARLISNSLPRSQNQISLTLENALAYQGGSGRELKTFVEEVPRNYTPSTLILVKTVFHLVGLNLLGEATLDHGIHRKALCAVGEGASGAARSGCASHVACGQSLQEVNSGYTEAPVRVIPYKSRRKNGGGGGSRTPVRKALRPEDYMLSSVQFVSPAALRMSKKRYKLVRWFSPKSCGPKDSSQPTG